MSDADQPRLAALDPVPLREHLAAMREADLRFEQAMREADQRFNAERDRRLSEVAVEREKALKIKEEADKAALALARADQTYKDEQANRLREQINAERNTYITTDQLAASIREMRSLITPLTDYMAGQQGRSTGTGDVRSNIGAILGAASVVMVLVFGVITVLAR
jgi:hypothetical protein